MHIVAVTAVPVGALLKAVSGKDFRNLTVKRNRVGIGTRQPMIADNRIAAGIAIIILVGIDVDCAADGVFGFSAL